MVANYRHEHVVKSDFRSTQLGHLRRLDANAESGRVVFLGSSTLQGLDAGSVSSRALNLSLGGDTVPGLISRLQSYQSLESACCVVLNIGLNDIVQGALPDQIPFQQVLAMLPAFRPTFVLGLQYVMSGEVAHMKELNSKIDSANQKLENLCLARSGCVYIKNPANSEVEWAKFRDLDGVHLSSSGYRELRAALRRNLSTRATCQ